MIISNLLCYHRTTAGGKIFHPDEPSNNDPPSWTDEPSCAVKNDVGDRSGTFCTQWKYSWGGYLTCDDVNTSCTNCSNAGAWCAVSDDQVAGDTRIADEMISRMHYIKESQLNRPFFMAVGFLKPHLPYAAPVRFYNEYNSTYPMPQKSSLSMPVS